MSSKQSQAGPVVEVHREVSAQMNHTMINAASPRIDAGRSSVV